MKTVTYYFLFLVTFLGSAFAQVPPSISIQPSLITIPAAANGTQPFTYQWRKNGVPIKDETRSTLIITDPKATGVYDCLISNSAGSVITPSVRLSNTVQESAADYTITRKQK